MDIKAQLEQEFGDWPGIVAAWGRERPDANALDDGSTTISWGELSARIDRVAAQLIADGLQRGQAVAILGVTSVAYALAYLGSIRAGGCAAPLTTSATPRQLANMLADSGAVHLFIDADKRTELLASGVDLGAARHIMLDAAAADAPDLSDWMAAEGSVPDVATPAPGDPFNIIYSSGTTGTPKGIVHSHAMRWRQSVAGFQAIYSENARSILSTPLYSNTTLAVFLPTMVHGGMARLMGRFDAAQWLAAAQAMRATHTMLVPVQYQRLMAHPEFDAHDLSSMQIKFCTSAPFSAELKEEALRRFPGGLVEIYGMTEGGVVCMLQAHNFPDKLHTVGQPVKGHELKVIDEEGRALPPGSKGEMVGRSPTMMSGYKNQPDKTRDMEWRDADGTLWFRMGDIGIVDEDGFVEIVGRAKDMIISGGFNIYPKDLEEVLMQQPGVADAAVVGMASERWGETPVGFVVAEVGTSLDLDALLATVNAELGKTQRLSALHPIEELPRSHIGEGSENRASGDTDGDGVALGSREGAKTRRNEGLMRDVEELASIAVDCGLQVHRDIGPGLLESVYEAVLAHCLAERGLHTVRQQPISINYRGLDLREGFKADIIIENQLIIEIKSVERLAPVHGKQLLTYLRLARLPVGLLMNFGGATFKEGLRRIVNDHTNFASSRLRVNQNHSPG